MMIHLSLRLVTLLCCILFLSCTSFKPSSSSIIARIPVAKSDYFTEGHGAAAFSLGPKRKQPIRSSGEPQQNKFRLYLSKRINGFNRSRRMRRNPKGIEFNISNAIIAANILMFLVTTRWPRVRMNLMKIDYRIARGETYRLFTALFLHGSTFHLFTNSYSLYNIGPQVICSY